MTGIARRSDEKTWLTTSKGVGHVSGRERLRDARLEKGLTQRQVAEAVGLTVRQYQNIESGRTLGKIPLWDALEDMLGINQRELRAQSREGSR